MNLPKLSTLLGRPPAEDTQPEPPATSLDLEVPPDPDRARRKESARQSVEQGTATADAHVQQKRAAKQKADMLRATLPRIEAEARAKELTAAPDQAVLKDKKRQIAGVEQQIRTLEEGDPAERAALAEAEQEFQRLTIEQVREEDRPRLLNRITHLREDGLQRMGEQLAPIMRELAAKLESVNDAQRTLDQHAAGLRGDPKVRHLQRHDLQSALRAPWAAPPTVEEKLGYLFLRFALWSRLPGSPVVELWGSEGAVARGGASASDTCPIASDDVYALNAGHLPRLF